MFLLCSLPKMNINKSLKILLCSLRYVYIFPKATEVVKDKKPFSELTASKFQIVTLWWLTLFPFSPWRTPFWSMWLCLKGSFRPQRAHTRVYSWQNLKPMKRSPQSIRFSDRICGPWGIHTEAICSWRTAPHDKDPCWSRPWSTEASENVSY